MSPAAGAFQQDRTARISEVKSAAFFGYVSEMQKERLPRGFWRAPNGSLRVLIRAKGFPPAVRTFKLHADTPGERRRQRVEAEVWAAEIRRRLYAGHAAATGGADLTLTLGDALRRYAREGLSARPANRRKDELRIESILKDEIASRRLVSLSLPDLAAYRDFLIDRDYERRILGAVEATDASAAGRARQARLRSLLALRRESRRQGGDASEELRRQIVRIEREEGIGAVARTTISNRMQLISRAMKYAAQTTHNVPLIAGLSMPASSPGRARRPTAQELEALLSKAAAAHPLLPFLIRLAITTGLRRERLLELRTSYLQDLTDGRKAIVFPPSSGRRKRTGVIPVTTEIEQTIVAIAAHLGVQGPLQMLMEMDIRLFPASANVLAHAWRGLLDQLGIVDLRFHDLRHEATSRLFERGLSAAEVMSITGHSTSEMVDRYSHYSSALVLDRLEGREGQNRGPDGSSGGARIDSVAGKSTDAAALIEDISRLLERLAALHAQGPSH